MPWRSMYSCTDSSERPSLVAISLIEIAVALALIYSTSFAVQRFFVSVLLISLNYVRMELIYRNPVLMRYI